MKVGDPVRVTTSKGIKFGVVVTHPRKKFMVGPVVEILIEGSVETILRDHVEVIKEGEHDEG